MTELDKAIRAALDAFVAELNRRNCWGKEREAVSVFVLGFLSRHVESTRIGIEVRVPQLPEPSRKEAVCKDVVIWKEPFDNVFTRPNEVKRVPVAVMEWKCFTPSHSRADVEWLKQFTARHQSCAGYAVRLFQDQGRWTVDALRIRGASVTRL